MYAALNFWESLRVHDALGEKEKELEALIESYDKTCTRYKMEISAEKTKLMTNSARGRSKVKGQKLGIVTSFKYLGAIVSDEGSKAEVSSRIAQATAALTKLSPVWRDFNISLGSKVKLMHSLVISIFLYACDLWTIYNLFTDFPCRFHRETEMMSSGRELTDKHRKVPAADRKEKNLRV